jgi:16S rRNA (cytosine967-C5)-methyltransferase
LQKKIVSNAIPQLQKGGSFIYITCSVFRKENEEVVDFIKENFDLNLEEKEVLKGYDKKADTMFVARFSAPGRQQMASERN